MKNGTKIYVGLSGVNSHDASASLLVDGRVIAAVEEERFIREKHTGKFPYNAVNFCLDQVDVKPGEIDCVSYYFNPTLRYKNTILFNLRTLYPRIEHIAKKKGIKAFAESIKGASHVEQLIVEGYKQAESFAKNNFKNASFRAIDHHDAHAAGAFYISPFQEASVLTVDLIGEWDTTRFYDADKSKLKKIKSISYPDSLGKFYQTFTKFLGFAPNSDEYKVMGLAAYGSGKWVSFFKSLYNINSDGSFSLNKDLLLFCKGIRPEWDEGLISKIGAPREKNEEVTQNHKDIAYALQKSTEEILLHLVAHLVKTTGKRKLSMAGGVALNALANQKIRESGLIDELYVQPASGDAGTSLGSALFSYFSDNPLANHHPMEDCYLGPVYPQNYIRQVAQKSGYFMQEGIQSLDEAVNLLTAGKIVALYQGRMEFGPRALGNRSILADPRNKTMKDTMNTKVKFRESFRPFAPAVLEEEVGKYFVNGLISQFMTQTFTATELCLKLAPAVVHQDGTSRIQTVSSHANPRLYSIIKRFEQKTGLPLIMNTSFNVAGEPIVCTPEDALQTFTHSGIDALIMENILLIK